MPLTQEQEEGLLAQVGDLQDRVLKLEREASTEETLQALREEVAALAERVPGVVAVGEHVEQLLADRDQLKEDVAIVSRKTELQDGQIAENAQATQAAQAAADAAASQVQEVSHGAER